MWKRVNKEKRESEALAAYQIQVQQVYQHYIVPGKHWLFSEYNYKQIIIFDEN